MNTDELLTQFRADVPLPDEATSRRIYAQATTRRRSLPRKRFAVAVAVAALGVAGGLFATVGGTTADRPAATTNGDRFFIPLENVSINRDGGTVTSIAFTVVDDHYPNGTLAVRVVRADETPVIGYDVKSEPVYEEHFPDDEHGLHDSRQCRVDRVRDALTGHVGRRLPGRLLRRRGGGLRDRLSGRAVRLYLRRPLRHHRLVPV